MSREDAVRAAAEALLAHEPPITHLSDEYDCCAEAAVAAAEPILRAAIAAEIEAERDRTWVAPSIVLVNGAQVLDRTAYVAQWTAAARIARGDA